MNTPSPLAPGSTSSHETWATMTGAALDENPERTPEWFAQTLELAALLGHATLVRRLLPLIDDGNEKQRGLAVALRRAAARGHTEAVDVLLPHVSDQDARNAALLEATTAGHATAVERLVSTCSRRHQNLALCEASTRGLVDVVQVLIPASQPRANHSEALWCAAEAGHIDVVRLLLPVSDPKAGGSQALSAAAFEGHAEVVDELLPVSYPLNGGNLPITDALLRGHWSILARIAAVAGPEEARREFEQLVGRDEHDLADRLAARLPDAFPASYLRTLPLSDRLQLPRIKALRDAEEAARVLETTLEEAPGSVGRARRM